MWFDPTRRAALLGALALGACGFVPVYGPDGSGAALRNKIAVETPTSVAGFRLGTALIERFGPTADAQYVLTVALSETRSAAAQTIVGDTTRFDLTGIAGWSLADLAGAVVAQGEAQTFTSYSATGSTVATQTAERDARERLSLALADIIVADVILSAP